MPDNCKQSDEIQTINLGCRLNAHECAGMAERAREAGLGRAVIVNTCAVTSEAVRQSRQAVRRARRNAPDEAVLIVTGCAAQIDPQDFASIVGVDAVIGNRDKLSAQSYAGLQRIEAQDLALCRVPDEADQQMEPGLPESVYTETGQRHRASVQVQNGCDHACTFCIIPQGRGRARSALIAQVVADVAALVDRGHAEIVLTGVDLTSWGQDLPDTPKLGDLVEAILLAVPALSFLRLSSVDVAEIDPKLRSLLMTQPRLAPYLHLSLQSGDDMILKRMKRRHSSAEAIALCADLRQARPDFAFGADLIAGFPTETEAMFTHTLRTIRACGLDYLHVFPFSPRPGTPAARMPQLPRTIIRQRAEILRQEGQKTLIRRLAKHVGQVRPAILEGQNRARLPDFAPVRLIGAEAGMDLRQAAIDVLGHDGQTLLGRLVL